MAKRTYKGSCHCRKVTFEADIDLAEGTGKCNCTNCWKKRWWSVRAPIDGFRPLSGAAELNKDDGQVPSAGGFCKSCGVFMYSRVDVSEWNPTAYVSVNVACLDDLDPADLVAAPIRYYDGLHNNWLETPAETRHL